MTIRRIIGTAALCAASALAGEPGTRVPEQGSMAVDRGLPRANWNDASGATARSNVRWTLYNQGFVGDDFRIGQPGERWVVNTLRVWAVPGAYDVDPLTLGDVYQDIRLYVGGGKDDLTPVSTGRLSRGSNAVEGADIVITEASDAPLYENFGTHFKIYQIEFRNLNLTVEGGERYRFGAWGLGRPIGEKGDIYPWFTHGSNAGRGEAPADGADGKLLLFEAAGRYAQEYDADGAAWNKSSDLNVQIYAHRELGGQLRFQGESTVAIDGAVDPSTVRLNGQAPVEAFAQNEVVFARFESISARGRVCVTARSRDGQAVRACGSR